MENLKEELSLSERLLQESLEAIGSPVYQYDAIWVWDSLKSVKGSGKVTHYSYHETCEDAWLDLLEHVADRSECYEAQKHSTGGLRSSL